MTVDPNPNLKPPGPTPAWTGPAAWIPLAHIALALLGGLLVVFHSTFRLTAGVQALVVGAVALLVCVGSLIYFLERKASLASMAAYLRSVVPTVLTVLDDAKGASPTIAARFLELERFVGELGPRLEAALALIPHASPATVTVPVAAVSVPQAQATTGTPLPVTQPPPPAAPVVDTPAPVAAAPVVEAAPAVADPAVPPAA